RRRRRAQRRRGDPVRPGKVRERPVPRADPAPRRPGHRGLRGAARRFVFPLVKTDWATQQRSPARALAAGMAGTPLEVTAAHVLSLARERGEPPLTRGFPPEAEQALLAQQDSRGYHTQP